MLLVSYITIVILYTDMYISLIPSSQLLLFWCVNAHMYVDIPIHIYWFISQVYSKYQLFFIVISLIKSPEIFMPSHIVYRNILSFVLYLWGFFFFFLPQIVCIMQCPEEGVRLAGAGVSVGERQVILTTMLSLAPHGNTLAVFFGTIAVSLCICKQRLCITLQLNLWPFDHYFLKINL